MAERQPITHGAVWFRVNGGPWNNNPDADPAKNIGGYDMSVSDGRALVPCATVAAGTVVANFGQNPFVFTVPGGGDDEYTFTPGWPGTTSEWTTFDPATIQNPVGHDGNVTDDGLGFNTESFAGGVTAFLADARTSGKYYWEWQWTRGTFFTAHLCMGPFAVDGEGEYSFFIGSAAFGPEQPWGGARYHGQLPFLASMTASIADDTLTVSAISGTPLSIGNYVFGPNVANHTQITGGSDPVWTVTPGMQDVDGETMTSSFFPSNIAVNDVAVDPAFDAMGADTYSIAVILTGPLPWQRTRYPDETAIPRRRVLPPTTITARTGSLGMSNLICTEFPPTDTPRNVNLRWSDDGGASWCDPVQQSAGEIGEYGRDIQYRQLGYSRNRTFELFWNGAMPEALTGAMVQYTVANT